MSAVCPSTGKECAAYDFLISSPENDVDYADQKIKNDFELDSAAAEHEYTSRALELCMPNVCGIITLGSIIAIKSAAIISSVSLTPKQSNREGI